MTIPMLATKLYIPPLPPKVVIRPRLIEQLTAGLAIGRKLSLIAAPAGFGKSTLASAWIAGCGRPAAWLSLDEHDGDPVRFLAYVVRALQGVAPALGAGILDALQSPQPPPLVRSLGADAVIDYTAPDFSASMGKYDVIFDAVAKFPNSGYAKHLAPGGAYVTMARLDSKESMDNLLFVKALLEASELKSVIDRCYSLDEIVAAHRYVDTGRKKGNVVIMVG